MAESGGPLQQSSELFRDQFTPDGPAFIYRFSQIGRAYRVSAEERDRFIDDYDRASIRMHWTFVVGGVVTVFLVVAISIWLRTEPSYVAPFILLGVVSTAAILAHRAIWRKPLASLETRMPIASALSRDEAIRRNFARISYTQLAMCAGFGVMLIFPGLLARDGVTNRWWFVVGAGLILLAAVQAFRKWHTDPGDLTASLASPSLTGDLQDAPVETSTRVWSIVALLLFVGGIGFLYTPQGRQMAQQPWFGIIVGLGLGGGALFTAIRGLSTGKMTPWMKGFANNYDRECQPKRFWASIAWNAVLGLGMLWITAQLFREESANHTDNQCYNGVGVTSVEQGIAVCDRLIDENPRDLNAYVGRGLIFSAGRQYGKAIADFTRAHELDPKSVWPLANRGLVYTYRDQFAPAKRDFAAARAIDPNNYVLLHGEATIRLNSGDPEGAISILNRNVARYPEDSWAYRLRSDAYQQMGKFDKANADRAKADKLARVVRTN